MSRHDAPTTKGAARPAGSATFSDEARAAVYAAIYGRRDIRTFRPEALPDEVLVRLLDAAHHGPSVGFMQPWSFLLIRNIGVRQQVKDLFNRERQAAACFFDEPRRSHYLGFKLEGILEAPVNLCVTCDPTAAGPAVLGRNSIPETDVYSTCCAIENLWLAARAEGIGVGWVSILKLPQLRAILGIPPHVIPVAYLCLGYPAAGFPERPLLQSAGWRDRTPLAELVHFEQWGTRDHDDWRGAQQALAQAAAPAPLSSAARDEHSDGSGLA
ncbi:MAG: 5,6-dimethylbenzimidazole synthase [Chloroflexi bacterium]|nr:5,6-dimethylbenzimidazole synthase [Chloroflexota bacterium]